MPESFSFGWVFFSLFLYPLYFSLVFKFIPIKCTCLGLFNQFHLVILSLYFLPGVGPLKEVGGPSSHPIGGHLSKTADYLPQVKDKPFIILLSKNFQQVALTQMNSFIYVKIMKKLYTFSRINRDHPKRSVQIPII